MNMTGYQCIACGAKQRVDYEAYTCPLCGGNLDVTYDLAAWRKAHEEGVLFPSERTDIFKYLALLPLQSADYAPPLRIGATPLYPAPRLGRLTNVPQIFLKDDSLNPSQSFKDRASAITIARAAESGARVIAGASTGNAGISMACMAAALEIPCVIFVPEKTPPAKIAQLLIYGAQVIAVRGTYDDAFDLCMQVCAEKGWYNRNTGHNPFTREGKKTCSYEICEQLDWNAPDRVIVPTGDGNILSGIWKGMKDLHAIGLIDRLPHIDCAQAEGSAAISQAVWRLREEGFIPDSGDWRPVRIESVQANTLADSISVDAPRDGLAAVRAVIESGGEAVTVSDEEILDALRELARSAGVFAEPSAACAWAGLKKMASSGQIREEERVVCLLTGCGLKDVHSARKAAGEPVLIAPDLNAALDALKDR